MINKIYEKHTIYFWFLSLALASLTFFISKNFLFSDNLIIPLVCLFLILTIGISHGALDNIKARKILKIYKINNKSIFYIVYVIISIIVIFFWILFPSLILLFFLLIASYHFGKEDTYFINKNNSNFDQFFYLLKGSLIISAPLFCNINETLKIFETIYLNEKILFFISDKHWVVTIFLGLSTFGYFYFLIKNNFFKFKILFLDIWSILIINVFFPPLIAFTLYFCFLHSIRHTISLANDLDSKNFKNGIKLFVKKALPLTAITGVLYLIAITFLSDSYEIDRAILKTIFIGLASLTFPHILLEYIINKNEK